jgi:RNA polymerase sigma factor (sigma-70 family)
MQAEQSANSQAHHRRCCDARLHSADDDTLLGWARAGNHDAFGVLYLRHDRDALQYAGGLSRRYQDPDAAEDVLADAIRKILTAMAAGSGPITNFRRYLFTSVRSTAVGHARERRRASTPDALTDIDDRAEDIVDLIVAADTLQTLPERWRQILWATCVEERTPAELAPVLGMRPNSVAALAHRARVAFRHAYLNKA